MCGQVVVWSCSCSLQMLFLSHKYYFYSLLLLLYINSCVYRVVVCTLLYFLAFIPMCVLLLIYIVVCSLWLESIGVLHVQLDRVVVEYV